MSLRGSKTPGHSHGKHDVKGAHSAHSSTSARSVHKSSRANLSSLPNPASPVSSLNTINAEDGEEYATYGATITHAQKSRVSLKVIIAITVTIIIVALGICAYVIWSALNYEAETLPPTQEAVIVVEQGESAKEITAALFKERLISNEQKFMNMINAREVAGSLIPGKYIFKGGTSAESIIDTLIAGPQSQARQLTIPEGLTRKEIAKIVADFTQGRVSESQFLEATGDASAYAKEYPFLESAGKNTLEGFLFPKTYPIAAGDDAKTIVKVMLDQFKEEVMPLSFKYPESQGLSLYETINLASIVEAEGTPEIFGNIASVFYNRLASKRPYLESDATTAYEVGREPTAQEVHSNTPYSTYSNAGLPPTPICNPSLEAIKAVCDPPKTDYVYFYSSPSGNTTFSTSLKDHEAAIRRG